MYLCLCHGVTDKVIKEILTSHKIDSVKELQKVCSAGQSCGSCLFQLRETVSAMKKQSEESEQPPHPVQSWRF